MALFEKLIQHENGQKIGDVVVEAANPWIAISEPKAIATAPISGLVLYAQQKLQEHDYGMQFMEHLVEKAMKLPLDSNLYHNFVQSVLSVVSQAANNNNGMEAGDHNNFLRLRLLLTA